MNMTNENLICPNCGCPITINLDSYGRTPFHLHCLDCEINIGATSIKKCIELFKKYHQTDTYIEYYNEDIQLMFEKSKCIIQQEVHNDT